MTIITKMFLNNLNLFIKPLERNYRNDNFFIPVYLTNESIFILNKMDYLICKLNVESVVIKLDVFKYCLKKFFYINTFTDYRIN